LRDTKLRGRRGPIGVEKKRQTALSPGKTRKKKLPVHQDSRETRGRPVQVGEQSAWTGRQEGGKRIARPESPKPT